MHGARRESKASAKLSDRLHDAQVDPLLHVHINVIARVQDDIDRLELERALAKIPEMAAIEPGQFFTLDDLLHPLRDLADLFGGAVIGQAKLEHNAAFLQPLVVLDGAADHVGVGHDNLLATQASDARGLQAHMLNRTGQRAHYDEIADFKGLVDGNGQRGEHIAQDVLHRQRHRDTAHAEAGDKRGDVDAQVRQHREQNHCP